MRIAVLSEVVVRGLLQPVEVGATQGQFAFGVGGTIRNQREADVGTPYICQQPHRVLPRSMPGNVTSVVQDALHGIDHMARGEAEVLEQLVRRGRFAEAVDAYNPALKADVFPPILGHTRFDRYMPYSAGEYIVS